MRYRKLGRTGMDVSAYCLGAMMFGKAGNPDHDECVRMVHTALDAGVNFIDTADMYSAGESEEVVGRALRGRRDAVILATKGHFPLEEGPNQGGNSRRWLVRAVEDSLRRLGTDWIDLYQIHRPDESTDVEETLSVLTDLVRDGKIRAFGSSTFSPDQVVEAQWVSERRGYGRIRTEQPPYSILARGIERHLLPVTQRYGMGVLVWSPLAFGLLSGSHRMGRPIDMTSGRPALKPGHFDAGDPAVRRRLEVVEQLVGVADDLGWTLPQLAIAFTIAHPGVTSTIIGPRTPQQLADVLAGAGHLLDDAVLDRIDEIVAPGVDLYDPLAATPPPGLAGAARRRPREERAAS